MTEDDIQRMVAAVVNDAAENYVEIFKRGGWCIHRCSGSANGGTCLAYNWCENCTHPGHPANIKSYRKEEEMRIRTTFQSSKPSNPKDAIGITKAPASTVPRGVVAETGVAMLEGALKYGRHNYRVVGVRSSVYFDAAIGHLESWWEGEDIDHDSGMSHITKAIASLVVLRDAMLQDKLNDDRPPKSKAPNMRNELSKKVAELLAKYPDPVEPHTQLSLEGKQ